MGCSIALAVGAYGVSFGALSVAAGLSVVQTCALSLLMFTGGSQFAFVGVVGGGGTGAAALSAASLLGIRNVVYGMQLNALFNPRGLLRLAHAQVTIDESTATALAQDDPAEQRRVFWTAGVGIFVFWNLMTLLGSLAGAAMGDPRRWGLDGAACAAFLGLLWPRLKQRDAPAIAVACAAVAVACVPVLPAGLPIVVAAVVAAALGAVRRPREAP